MCSRYLRLSLAPIALALTVALSIACGGGRPVSPNSDAATSATISGYVVKGRVNGATVTAYSITPSGEREVALGSGTTDSTGAFTINGLRPYNGRILLVATGGTYAEEAVAGATIRLEAQELTYLVPSYRSLTSIHGIAITPVSHLATGLALYWVQHEGKSVEEAGEEAWQHLGNHFGGLLGGGLDWQHIVPADFGSSGNGQLDAPGRAGLLLAALSQQARQIAERAALTPGAALSSMALVGALYQDINSDGFFDGQGHDGKLLLPRGGFIADAGPTAYALDGQTLRLALAQNVERFIRSERNQSGLTVNDVGPLVQQVASNSDSRIFRTAGTDFDHDAPTVTFRATFSRLDGITREPIGSTRLVGGTLSVTAEVTDASTIQSITLSGNGAPITTTASGSGTHWTLSGSFPTSAEGPLTLAASVADVHGNSAVVAYVLTVDNTPPSIVAAPDSPAREGFYNATVPIDVTAEDANGVTQFTHAGFIGFTNRSGVISRITGTWEIATAQSDGTVVLALNAKDAAFNTATLEIPVHIDRTPPSVTVAAPQPPRYTKATSLVLHVAATDLGAGVSAVKASVNGAPESTVITPNGNTWDVPVELGPEGAKRIVIWAVDRVTPAGNSSFPTALVVDITRDATTPSPLVNANVGSYYDERPTSTNGGTTIPGMGLQVDSSGSPVVPPIYTFPPGAAKRAVTGASEVFKAATRLSWGATAPTVAELYSQDGSTRNVPFIVFDVPVTASQAPINSTVPFTITCENCSGFPPAIGTLLQDTAFNSDPQRFLLPLTIETVPGLAFVPPAANLKVLAQFTDEAGNSKDETIKFTFRVIGPPLIIKEDASYSTAADPKSAYGYRTGPARTYAQLFNAGNFIPDGQIRLIRYTVENPAPFSIALSTTSLGNHHVTEAWADKIASMNNDGNSPAAPGAYVYSSCNPDNHYIPTPPPCGGLGSTPSNGLYAGYYPSSHCVRPPGGIPSEGEWSNPPGMVATTELSGTAIYLNPQPSGRETTAAPPVPGTNGSFVVPASSGNAPGKAVIYVNRSALIDRVYPIARADVLYPSSASLGNQSYSFTFEDFWYHDGWPRMCCLRPDDPENPGCIANGERTYLLRRHARYLTSATHSTSGSISISAQGLTNAGTLLGEAASLVNNRSFSVTFTH